LKLTSWNLNGVRSCIGAGPLQFIAESDADIFAFQETKSSEVPGELLSLGYGLDWYPAERQGYSGTCCLYRKKPIAVTHGIGEPKLDVSGRLITLEYPAFYFVNLYNPNSQGTLDKWYFRLDWDEAVYAFLNILRERKPVIACGDFNVASEYIDVYPENTRNIENDPGFKSEERDAFHNLIESGYVDTFRLLHPEEVGAYTWWHGKADSRVKNRGRRIDYILVSDELVPLVRSATIRADITGSDHTPIEVVIDQ
jgi:exodeoxyribonuclease-3